MSCPVRPALPGGGIAARVPLPILEIGFYELKSLADVVWNANFKAFLMPRKFSSIEKRDSRIAILNGLPAGLSVSNPSRKRTRLRPVIKS